MGSTDNIFVNGTIQSLRKHNMAMDILDSAQAKARYPMVSFPDNFRFVLDHSGGILRADKALKAFQVSVYSIFWMLFIVFIAHYGITYLLV